jgi:hypothetical protein
MLQPEKRQEEERMAGLKSDCGDSMMLVSGLQLFSLTVQGPVIGSVCRNDWIGQCGVSAAPNYQPKYNS